MSSCRLPLFVIPVWTFAQARIRGMSDKRESARSDRQPLRFVARMSAENPPASFKRTRRLSSLKGWSRDEVNTTYAGIGRKLAVHPLPRELGS